MVLLRGPCMRVGVPSVAGARMFSDDWRWLAVLRPFPYAGGVRVHVGRRTIFRSAGWSMCFKNGQLQQVVRS